MIAPVSSQQSACNKNLNIHEMSNNRIKKYQLIGALHEKSSSDINGLLPNLREFLWLREELSEASAGSGNEKRAVQQ